MSTLRTIFKKAWPVTIRGQLIVGIVLVHLLLMSIFVSNLVIRQRNFLRKQAHDQALGFAKNYAANASAFVIANDFDALERLTLSQNNLSNLKYAMILSLQGVVLAHTDYNLIGKRPTDKVSLQLPGPPQTKTMVEDDQLIDIAVPIFNENEMVGWAREGVSQTFIQNNLATIITDGIFYIVMAIIAGILLAIPIGNMLTRGLDKLISVADKIKRGDRHIRAIPSKNAELFKLGTAFNQMLDEISANETLLTMVIENMPVGVWVFNKKGSTISGNRAGQQIWSGMEFAGMENYAEYKAWNRKTGKMIEPDQWAVMRAIKEGQTTINEEIEIETLDGHEKIILSSAIPLMGKEGNIIGGIAINVDITDSKKMTEQLALSESTLSSAFTHSAIGITLVLLNGKFSRVNRELCRMVGYTEEELLNLTFQDITYPEDLEKDLNELNRTLAGEIDSYRMDKRYFRKDGSIIWVHLTVSLVRDSHNNPQFFVSQIEDISERKKAEALMKESEEKFRKLVEETLVGVFILQKGKFVYVNPQFEKMTGYSKTLLLGRMSFAELLQGDIVEKDMEQTFSAIAQEKPSGYFLLKARRIDGELVQIEVILSPITLDGHPAVIGTIIDVTEQVEEEKRINKAVANAQESERHEISMELHDNVKQIMAGCLLNIDFLKMVVKDDKLVPIINNIKNYLRDAIEELRRISHQLAPSIDESISLEEKIRTVIGTMNVSKAIEINYRFDKLEHIVKGDVQLAMYRIVQEQFTNILKHSNASLVDITVKGQNGDICMSIEDNGVGFDPSSSKNGIGLENIKRRVQVFNGNFSIQTLPGKGCRLFVQLPVN